MGRMSLAEQTWEHYSQEPPGDITWLIIYDFQRNKPPTKFYDNINRINNMAVDGEFIQQSVYRTTDRRAAISVKDLVEHYGGQVLIFRAKQIFI